MSDNPDPRLDEIQAIVANHSKSPGGIYGPGSDVDFLLAELRKARQALAVVEHWTGRFETNQSSDIAKRQNAQFDLGYSAGRRSAGSILRDAVAAAMGDGE
jgi:hypothetical protein